MREFALVYIVGALIFTVVQSLVTGKPAVSEYTWFWLAFGAALALVRVGDRR
jgi:hypothetical protein